jgi:hypothetical protein
LYAAWQRQDRQAAADCGDGELDAQKAVDDIFSHKPRPLYFRECGTSSTHYDFVQLGNAYDCTFGEQDSRTPTVLTIAVGCGPSAGCSVLSAKFN